MVKILCVEETLIVVTVHTIARWVNPVWPAEPTFSILMLRMGACERRRHVYYKARIFFVDMLPVKVSIYL